MAGEWAVKVREGRGGLRRDSLRAPARVRVFNSISHTVDGGDRGWSPLSFRVLSVGDSARVRVLNLYLELECGGGDGLSNDATDKPQTVVRKF